MKTSTPAGPIIIVTQSDAEAAVGKPIRFTGTVRREKPGDSVYGEHLDILCPDYRFPDSQVDTVTTIEGTLRLIRLPEAVVSKSGAQSQGVMPGSAPRFALADCGPTTDARPQRRDPTQ